MAEEAPNRARRGRAGGQDSPKEEGALVSAAADQARDILGRVFRELQESGAGDGEPRLFFPSGIGLIEVTVEIAPVKVSLRVAGEKGASAPSAAPVSETAFEAMLESIPAGEAGDLVLGQRVPDRREIDVVGAPTTIIRRGTPEFAALVRNDNPDIVFKDEEGTAADRMMTPRLKETLDVLASLVKDRVPGFKLRVTEAWDENLEHAQRSVHYEGRGADLTTFPLDASKLGRLARLAVEAGLDWVLFEDKRHVHVSVAG